MHTYVNICFEIPDQKECDVMFTYLTAHPKDIWNYEDRVEQKFVQVFDRSFMHDARWTDDDILDTRESHRQLYVAVTRARRELTLVFCKGTPNWVVDVLPARVKVVG